MRTVEGILEEYRKGNFSSRMNLFIEHRDLREEFTQIDLDETPLPKAAVSEKKTARIPGVACFVGHRIAR